MRRRLGLAETAKLEVETNVLCEQLHAMLVEAVDRLPKDLLPGLQALYGLTREYQGVDSNPRRRAAIAVFYPNEKSIDAFYETFRDNHENKFHRMVRSELVRGLERVAPLWRDEFSHLPPDRLRYLG